MKYYVDLAGALDVVLNADLQGEANDVSIDSTDLIGEANDVSIDYRDFYNEFSSIRDEKMKKALYDVILFASKGYK